jgi:hypothetical protein
MKETVNHTQKLQDEEFRRKVLAILEADISTGGRIARAIWRFIELKLRRHGTKNLR